ncbi:MAG: glycosyltransferase [Mycoplasma sp.]
MDKDMQNTIQQQQINNDNVFFTKKKVITMIALLIVVVCAIVTSTSLFNINFDTIGNFIQNAFETNPLFSLWVCLSLLFPIYFIFLRAWSYSYKLKKNNIKAKWYEWISFSLICGFLNAVTPFSIGSEPYCIYWLRKKGLALQKASVIVAANTIIFPFIQILITWPSFFVLCASYDILSLQPQWMMIFWFSFMGLIFDILGFVCLWLLAYSKNIHFLIGVIVNKSKKLLKMKYINNNEIRIQFKEKASFQKDFTNELKDWKFMIIFSLGTVLWNFIYYFSMYFSLELISPSGLNINFWDVYHYTNVSLTANNFIPIPGGEGTLQYFLGQYLFFGNSIDYGNTGIDPRSFVDSGVFIWRSFTYYLMAAMGLIPFVIQMISNFRNSDSVKLLRKNNKEYDKTKVNTFSIVIPAYNCASYISKTLDSVINTNYDKDNIEVLIIDDGSSDDTVKVAKEYSKKYKFIKVYEKPNGQWGSVINYVKNNQLAKNDFISILDSDDFYNPKIFDIFNKIAKGHSLLFGSFSRWNGKRKVDYIIPFFRVFTRSFINKSKMRTPICLPLIFTVKKEVFYKINDLTEGVPFQDTDYLTQLIYHTETAAFTTKNIASYFFNRENNTKTQEWNQKRFDSQIIACEKAIKNDSQELVSFFINEAGFRKMLIKNNYKFTITRNFKLNWLPSYLSWAYKIIHFMFIKKFFILIKDEKNNK